ncbi:hypothetical protein SFRURICE_016162 [Spodoptera frugiperda]|nr:hypothetical protein SFRURICE_016162 [Spodoptera frugiperda]
MKAIIILFGILLTGVLALLEEPTNYHNAIGIPLAKRIKALEEAILANETIIIEDRIIGGDVAPTNAFPFFAGLLISLVGTPNQSVCGATLLSPNRVVTAAHCNFDGVLLASEFTVVLGSNFIHTGGKRIATSEVVMHPYFVPATINDVAILYLPENVVFTGYPMCHSYKTYSWDIRPWLLALEALPTNVIDNADCEPLVVTPENICTSGIGPVGHIGICSGDSGGPLITLDFNGNPILIGITSFRSRAKGCEGGAPSGFTRVTKVQTNYHDAIGIPAVEKIRALEEASLANEAVTNNNRIVGGALAPVGAHPYFGGLLINLVGTTSRSVCGSSLLSANRLVTAAHCWFDGVRQAWEFTVILGSNWLHTGGERIATRQVIMHPQYVPRFLTNDIAMIYLPWNAMMTANVRPIRLPRNMEVWNQFEGHWAMAAGFGKTSDLQQTSASVVSHVSLQVINTNTCASRFEAGFVTHSTLCTSGVGSVGICGGDSGGPLAAHDNFGEPFLIGISSFAALNMCQGGFPSGFARVTSFVGFISQHM